MSLRFGSLFSGCGTFDLGLERAGLRCAWQCESDATCRDVLAKHWPDIECHKDVRGVDESAARVDLLCGGWPCQDLSVAGKRAGLAGERSGLFHEFIRVTAAIAPRWILGENVPGLLSSHGGRDMATVVAALAKLGYFAAWRVLDAQYFGVPQRRRRVFVVASLGDASCAEILFERDCLPGDSAAGREAGADIAYALAAGAGGSKFGSGRDGQDTFVIDNSGVRRLTPRECERLQGLPDDWTRWGASGTEISDSRRYQMIGNAGAVPVLEWIGRRIIQQS